MYEEIVTLSGLVVCAVLFQSDFYREEPIRVCIDNPVTGEVTMTEMDLEQFLDLQDLMATPVKQLPGGPIIKPLGAYREG